MSQVSKKSVQVFSDGACSGNPGPGGWAAILRYAGREKEIFGGALATTNNRMELEAAVQALAALKETCHVEFTTDSEYVRNGINSWIHNWKKNGWKTASRKPVQNRDLWERLDQECARHQIEWHWVKGHAGHLENERCDELARSEIERIRSENSSLELERALEQFTRGE